VRSGGGTALKAASVPAAERSGRVTRVNGRKEAVRNRGRVGDTSPAEPLGTRVGGAFKTGTLLEAG